MAAQPPSWVAVSCPLRLPSRQIPPSCLHPKYFFISFFNFFYLSFSFTFMFFFQLYNFSLISLSFPSGQNTGSRLLFDGFLFSKFLRISDGFSNHLFTANFFDELNGGLGGYTVELQVMRIIWEWRWWKIISNYNMLSTFDFSLQNREARCLLALTVKQICELSSNDESNFVIDGVEVTNVSIITTCMKCGWVTFWV